jgi:uncharacterized membrane protein YoaT (DUF817 family)
MNDPVSAVAQCAPLARLAVAEARLARWAAQRPVRRLLYEFLRFGVKQAWSSLFGILMVALLIATHLYYPRGAALARYDFLFLAVLSIQALLILARFESLQEAKVILLFHVVGTIMEIFKTAVGSWVYPEAALFRIGGVPLFTGFMYAAIGSYMMRAWTVFDFRFTRHPPVAAVVALAAAIYANFFLHHFVYDLRAGLFVLTAALFARTSISYRVHHSWRSMPLLLAAALASVFIYFAENIGTFTHTWLYPNQLVSWSPVGLTKLGSWFLLQIVSYALVVAMRAPLAPDAEPLLRSRERHRERLAAYSARADVDAGA